MHTTALECKHKTETSLYAISEAEKRKLTNFGKRNRNYPYNTMSRVEETWAAHVDSNEHQYRSDYTEPQ
jgi:Holliday junction resolvase